MDIQEIKRVVAEYLDEPSRGNHHQAMASFAANEAIPFLIQEIARLNAVISNVEVERDIFKKRLSIVASGWEWGDGDDYE